MWFADKKTLQVLHLLNLDDRSLCALMRTCKHLYELLSNDMFWQYRIIQLLRLDMSSIDEFNVVFAKLDNTSDTIITCKQYYITKLYPYLNVNNISQRDIMEFTKDGRLDLLIYFKGKNLEIDDKTVIVTAMIHGRHHILRWYSVVYKCISKEPVDDKISPLTLQYARDNGHHFVLEEFAYTHGLEYI